MRFNGAPFGSAHATVRDVGFLGDRTMVNGTLARQRDIGAERVRLRLRNASAARSCAFVIAGGRPMSLPGIVRNDRAPWTGGRCHRGRAPLILHSALLPLRRGRAKFIIQ
ncbi:hypothetical protein [Nocardia sp. R7R-8]|uniref:hypothetical protein n=1 Tax=Nocardia sp. R7R-8 TaxID=3459304 RepID=UPI00403D9E21